MVYGAEEEESDVVGQQGEPGTDCEEAEEELWKRG